MSKYRVYELAKEFNTTSRVIIDILARNNIVAKNHMSSVDEAAKLVIDHTFARKTGGNESKAPEVKAGRPETVKNPATGPAGNDVKPSSRPESKINPSRQPKGTDRRGQQPGAAKPAPAGQGERGDRYYRNNQKAAPATGAKPVPQGQRTSNQNNNQPNVNARPNRNGQPARTANGPRTTENADHGRKNFTSDSTKPREQKPFSGNFSKNRPHNTFGNRRSQPGGANRPNRHQQSSSSDRNLKPVKTEPVGPKTIKLGGPLTVKELSTKLGREVGEVIKKLMLLGIMASINQEVDLDTATILAAEFGATVEELPPEEDPTEIPEIEDDEQQMILRPPVVTVMGHVDHGKTSLLDSIRQTHVTSHEAGGITQHIGAYQVLYQGKKIVFLDTPGHEAFTAMRARGAQVTDIAVLVVAADDGVMPQTIEAINHAKSAKVPIIVAINKMDRPGANPDRVKQQLSEHGLLAEDWGGDTIMVPVSAHKKTGISDLLEMILLVAEMQEIKANPNRPAYGSIIEAKIDKGRGPVATALVLKGTLRIGDSVIAGTAYGKVRAMVNDHGDKVKKAEPSIPVEVLGLSDVPQAGDIFAVVDEKTARTVAEKRIAKKRTEEQRSSQKVSLDDLFKQIQEGNIKELNIVVKADVQGSVEALSQSLQNLNAENSEVKVSIVHAGVGAINESDVMLASASNALIIGFNVRPDSNARKMIETEKVDVRTYRVIYEAISDVEAALKGLLAPEFKEAVLGRVEVRQVFSIAKNIVAGCYVTEGKVTNSSQIRIIRNGIVVHEGNIDSLRRFKDDVKEVSTGFECGISVEKFRDIKEGDIIEAYVMEEVKRPNA